MVPEDETPRAVWIIYPRNIMKERKRKEKINFFEISVSNLGVRIHNGKVLRNLFGALHYHATRSGQIRKRLVPWRGSELFEGFSRRIDRRF